MMLLFQLFLAFTIGCLATLLLLGATIRSLATEAIEQMERFLA